MRVNLTLDESTGKSRHALVVPLNDALWKRLTYGRSLIEFNVLDLYVILSNFSI